MVRKERARLNKLVLIVVAAALLAGGSSLDARASGFALIEQSVRGLGNAFAGGAAVAEDATTIFFNPAGLTRLEGNNLELGLHLVRPDATFHNGGSTLTPLITDDDGNPIPLVGSDGEAGYIATVPNIYWARKMNDKLHLGLGLNVPFGLETEYDDDWVGRYHGVKSAILTFNVNPTLAYKVNDQWSLGVGLNAQYLDAELSNAIDFGTINAVVGAGLPLTPMADDGFVTLTADGYAYGFNLGILFEQSEETRYGLAYRSEMDYELEGDAGFTTPNAYADALAGLAGLVDGPATTDITLPQSLSLSAYHDLNEKWALMGDVTWTGWSCIEELRVEFANGADDSVTTLEWDDTYRLALGFNYDVNEEWDFRFGVAWDETPIPSEERRSVRVPGNDRYWLALGGTYAISDTLALTGGYAHLFISHPVINKSGTEAEDITRGALRGEYDNTVDILSVQLSWSF